MSNTKQEERLEINFMKKIGFHAVDISGYDSTNRWTYAKQVSETPEHLTNGTSFWVVSRNQSKELKRLINSEVTSVLEELISQQTLTSTETIFETGESRELVTIPLSVIQSVKERYEQPR